MTTRNTSVTDTSPSADATPGVQLVQPEVAQSTQPGLFDHLPDSAFTVQHRALVDARVGDRMLLCLALDVSPSAVKVATALAFHGWSSWPSRETLASLTNLHPNHVSRGAKELEDCRHHLPPPALPPGRDRRHPVHLRRRRPGRGHRGTEPPNARTLDLRPSRRQRREYQFGIGGRRPESRRRREYQYGIRTGPRRGLPESREYQSGIDGRRTGPRRGREYQSGIGGGPRRGLPESREYQFGIGGRRAGSPRGREYQSGIGGGPGGGSRRGREYQFGIGAGRTDNPRIPNWYSCEYQFGTRTGSDWNRKG